MFLSISASHLIIMLISMLFGIIPLVLCIIALVDILKSDFKDSSTKLIWALVVIFLPLIGSILYFVMGKDQKV